MVYKYVLDAAVEVEEGVEPELGLEVQPQRLDAEDLPAVAGGFASEALEPLLQRPLLRVVQNALGCPCGD